MSDLTLLLCDCGSVVEADEASMANLRRVEAEENMRVRARCPRCFDLTTRGVLE